MKRSALILGGMFMATTLSFGQLKGVDYYSVSELAAMSRAQIAQATESASGIAPENLKKYPNHYTMLTTRVKSGGAEMHRDYADIFIVVDGEATLVTGGSIKDAKALGNGETQGAGVTGGSQQILRKGDIVHISPNVPHQLLLSHGEHFTYFVVKVRESQP